jgi:hypothetical protein
MKALRRLVLFLALLGIGAFMSHPTSAREGSSSSLQLSASGRQGIVAMAAGCTRITNRFCAQSTRSNCSACR